MTSVCAVFTGICSKQHRSCTSFHTRWWAWYVCFFINRLKELVSNSARGHFSKSWKGFGSGKSAALTSVLPLSSVARRSSKWQWRILRSGSRNSSRKFSDPKRPLWVKRRAGVETINLQVALQERFPSAYSSRAKSGFRPRGQRSKSGYAFSGRPLSSSTTVTVANPVIKVRPMSMR